MVWQNRNITGLATLSKETDHLLDTRENGAALVAFHATM